MGTSPGDRFSNKMREGKDYSSGFKFSFPETGNREGNTEKSLDLLILPAETQSTVYRKVMIDCDDLLF